MGEEKSGWSWTYGRRQESDLHALGLVRARDFGCLGYVGKAAARPPHSILELGAEGVFVETDGGGMAGFVVDSEDVEAERAIAYVAFG